mmetsp:Transcript_33418/g.96569  ORF Transcript_33418/g.96569 Transcript_33418/m.96569 type:complete len:84 (-) Transcript_33418:287-538(-)
MREGARKEARRSPNRPTDLSTESTASMATIHPSIHPSTHDAYEHPASQAGGKVPTKNSIMQSQVSGWDSSIVSYIPDAVAPTH